MPNRATDEMCQLRSYAANGAMRTGVHALRYVAAELGVDASTNVTIAGDGSGAVAAAVIGSAANPVAELLPLTG